MNKELRNKIVGLCMPDLETLVSTNPIGAKDLVLDYRADVIQRFNKKVITGVSYLELRILPMNKQFDRNNFLANLIILCNNCLDKHGVPVDTVVKVLDDDEKDGYIIYEIWCPDSNKETRVEYISKFTKYLK